MSLKPSEPSSGDAAPVGPLSRRTLFAGAGTVGALAAAASVIPLAKSSAPVAAAAVAPAVSDGGYQLTEHVQRYYQTARV